MTDKDKEELEAWREAGEEIYPYIRHFGMSGASVEAISAARKIGRLLGEIPDNSEIDLEQLSYAIRSRTITEVAEWFINECPQAFGLLESRRSEVVDGMYELIDRGGE